MSTRVKHIIKKLWSLPPKDREVWLEAIMGEFDEDFGHAKWREGYEQGKSEGAWVGEQLKDADKIRRELNRPVVPQYIADFIAEQKKHGLTLSYSIDASMSDRVAEWYWDNPELFVRSWLDGYEVEKEKRYTVKIKAVNQYLVKNPDEEFLGFLQSRLKSKFTRKELEDAGVGWVFDCEGIEIEEVQE
ncbi:DUF1642 domain-containing protein [Streptococcus gordonii]|uniref:DUF1642 domain-containing protein n=1 Tax=Streptococcus gordonii TaxID=1302 RepID=UPI0010DE6E57|nr:DUF1642 domain-containing protein [Streptococcus gordonii]VTS13364.1 phage protein [Streptococcus gordonii]VTS24449.1 phage protein [Streptococcus gordonii]